MRRWIVRWVTKTGAIVRATMVSSERTHRPVQYESGGFKSVNVTARTIDVAIRKARRIMEA